MDFFKKTKEFIFYIIFILLFYISDISLMYILKKGVYISNEISRYVLIKNIILSIIFVFISLFFVKKSKSNKSILKIIVVTILAFFFMEFVRKFIINNLVVYFFNFRSSNSIFVGKLIRENYLYIFNLIILTPIVEEFVFRKAIFGCLYDLYLGCNKYVRFMTAFLISGILFCSIHDGVFAPSSISYLFGSLIYSSLYLYSKSIIPSVVIHGLHNLVFVLISLP